MYIDKCILKISRLNNIKYFEHRKFRFVLDPERAEFVLNDAILKDYEPAMLHGMTQGLSHSRAHELLLLHGQNQITVESKPVWKILMTKCTEIFYLFQWSSVTIWILESYYTYAAIVLVMSLTSSIWEVYSTKTNQILLGNLTKNQSLVTVVRESKQILIGNEKLVVGDCVVIDHHMTTVPCDMILISGLLMTDESSLTGESNPVPKFALPLTEATKNIKLNIEKHRSNVLFCGSKISQVSGHDVDGVTNNTHEKSKKILAIVLATGFYSSKGELFRSILYPTTIVNLSNCRNSNSTQIQSSFYGS